METQNVDKTRSPKIIPALTERVKQNDGKLTWGDLDRIIRTFGVEDDSNEIEEILSMCEREGIEIIAEDTPLDEFDDLEDFDTEIFIEPDIKEPKLPVNITQILNELSVNITRIITEVDDGYNPVRMYLKEIEHIPFLTDDQERELIDRIKSEDEGDRSEAQKQLAVAYLPWVVAIVKEYDEYSHDFLDLIQAGNSGLIKAIEKFDYHKSYNFYPYAVAQIKQSIFWESYIKFRIPVHMVETINKLTRVSRNLLQKNGREPTDEEIAEEMEVSVARVREIKKIMQEPISEDCDLPANVSFASLKEQLENVLGIMTNREIAVLRLRFGILDGRTRTIEQVGWALDITDDCARETETRALRKLRHPFRSKKLKDFLDGLKNNCL